MAVVVGCDALLLNIDHMHSQIMGRGRDAGHRFLFGLPVVKREGPQAMVKWCGSTFGGLFLGMCIRRAGMIAIIPKGRRNPIRASPLFFF